MGLGGAATLVHDVIMNWPNDSDRIELVVFFDEFNERYSDISRRANIIFLHKKKTIDFVFNALLKKTILRLNPDVISSHLTCTFYLSLVLKKWKCLFTHTIHSFPDKDLPWLYRLFLKKKIKKGSIQLIGCGKNVTSLAKKLYKVDINCIANGISINKENNSFKNDNCSFNILTVSRLSQEKRVIDLVKAMNYIKTSKDVCLTIIGDGPMRDELQHYLDSHKTAIKITIAGFKDSVDEFYSSSNVFCLVSEREGLPIVVLEAMNYGLPIVATDNGGNTELVKHGYNGFLVNVGDIEGIANALTEIINNQKLCMEFSFNSRKMLNDYSIQKTSKMYYDYFKERVDKNK